MATQLGIIHPGLSTSLSPNFFPSLLTIQATVVTQSPTGAPVNAWANVTGLIGLACRIAPQGGTESRTATQILTQDVQTCLIPQELLGITTKHRAVVDGDYYDVTSIDYDAQQLPGNHRRLTKLTLKVVS